jgi:transcriptional regulator GlxA family with amidase domain
MAEPLTITDVAVPIDHGIAPFELGIACELFGLDRSDQGLPTYRFALAAAGPGPVRTTAGYTVSTPHGLDRLATADLICLVAGDWTERPPGPELAAQLRAAHERGAHIMAICRGTFVAAHTGLLDGRRATTHWRWTDELARRFPAVRVEPDVLYVDTGDISTSAGTAAGIDLGLHLLRRAHGDHVAAEVARRMVVPPHRDGGQAQYLRRPLPPLDDAGAVHRTLAWATAHLDRPLTVDELARHAALAPRTFARHVVEVTGVPPHRWLVQQRVHLAQTLLETTDLAVTAVGRRSGFGSPDALRAAFARAVGVPPATYRRHFRGSG